MKMVFLKQNCDSCSCKIANNIVVNNDRAYAKFNPEVHTPKHLKYTFCH